MIDFLVRHRGGSTLDALPFRLDLLREHLGSQFLDQDFYAGLVLVIAPAEAVVDTQDRVQIIQDLGTREPIPDHVPDHGCTSEPATDQYAEPDFTGIVSYRMDANVMHQGRSAIYRRARDGDLELAWQIRELGM